VLLKNVSILIVITLFFAFPLAAQKKTEVFLKYSKQEGVMRIVIEGEELFIGKTRTAVSASHIKIEFPEVFHLNLPGVMPFEALQAEKSLSIALKEKGEIKSFRLASPSRIVFDVQGPDIHADKQAAIILSNVVVIDAGHGGYDFGMPFKDINEKDLNLDVATELGASLSKKGKKVFLVRKADQHMSIAERINFANQKKPDVFISLHCSTSRNFAIYISGLEEQGTNEMMDAFSLAMRQKKYIAKSKALADCLGNAVKEEFKLDVVRREMSLPILNSLSAASVLIEIPSSMSDGQMKTKLINAIIKGLAVYGQ
jgi:N-acetylmuramoyl-L-alanine amidase